MRTWGTHQTAQWFVYTSWWSQAQIRVGSAREAQKRPAGPIVSGSPNSFVFSSVVGLYLFSFSTYEKHTLPAMNIVCRGTGLQRPAPLRDHSGETFEDRKKTLLAAIIRKVPHPC